MRKFDVEALERAAEFAGVDLNVFLAGPFIDPNGPEPNSGPYVDAAKVRYFVFHKLKEDTDIASVIGEHRQLREIYQEHFGRLANAALMEIAHIIDKSDCVIIIPNSPGSFCELGLFSNSEKVCKKMLILLDQTRRNPPGYVHLGPVALAQGDGARIEYVDYGNKSHIWGIVNDFVSTMKSYKLSKRYRIGG